LKRNTFIELRAGGGGGEQKPVAMMAHEPTGRVWRSSVLLLGKENGAFAGELVSQDAEGEGFLLTGGGEFLGRGKLLMQVQLKHRKGEFTRVSMRSPLQSRKRKEVNGGGEGRRRKAELTKRKFISGKSGQCIFDLRDLLRGRVGPSGSPGVIAMKTLAVGQGMRSNEKKNQTEG